MVDGSSTTIHELSVEEKNIVGMYRNLSRWEKNALFLLLQSLAWGGLNESTDSLSWREMRKTLGIDQAGFAYREKQRHG